MAQAALSMHIDATLLERIRVLAKREGIAPTRWMIRACEERVNQYEWLPESTELAPAEAV